MLPQEIKDDMTVIDLPIDGVIPGLGVCNQGYSGGYFRHNKTAYCCASLISQWYTDFIVWHEVGHHFYQNYLTQGEIAGWEKLFNRVKKLGKHNFFRAYGMTNADECFGDVFACMVNKGPQPKLQKLMTKEISRLISRKTKGVYA